MTERPLTQHDVERLIVRIGDELEEETYRYATLSDTAAAAEADYKLKAARLFLTLAAEGTKLLAAEKQAKVDVGSAEEYRTWKIAEARRQASREALLSYRARLDATRTLSANIRHQT
jgi:hypothetical protein